MVPLIRKKRVGAAVKRCGAEALLVTQPADVRYLTGFTGSNAALIVKGSRVTMFTDGRYTTQAANEVDDAQIVIVVDKPVSVAACEWAVERGIGRCGFDITVTTVAGLEGLKAALPAKLRRSFFVPVKGLGCRLFDQVLEHVVPGAPEMEVAMALEYMARLEGAEGMSFDTIVAGGERSALPHGRATNAKLPKRGFVVLDFGVALDGYCSDMTRTVHMGAARQDEFEAYEAVLAAQEAGVAAVRAGVTCAEVDGATRSVLQNAGLAEWFTHSTGHGVGLEIHEAPRVGKLVGKNPSQKLKAGMIVTIEPGVYLPGKFGVRIEDTVLVTQTGCEILTPSTKAWIEL
jgi:Xaa-Pro aminopeptidase